MSHPGFGELVVEQELAVEGVARLEDQLDVEPGIAEDLLEHGGKVFHPRLIVVQHLDRQPVGVAGLGEQFTERAPDHRPAECSTG